MNRERALQLLQEWADFHAKKDGIPEIDIRRIIIVAEHYGWKFTTTPASPGSSEQA